MGIKIGIIGGSGLDNLNIFTNARDTFTGTGRRNRGHSRGRIGASWAQPYDCALFSQLPG